MITIARPLSPEAKAYIESRIASKQEALGNEYTSTSEDRLTFMIEWLWEELSELQDSYRGLSAELGDLLEERRDRLKGALLPGFHCVRCSAFTGTAKEEHLHCRCCGAPRPEKG